MLHFLFSGLVFLALVTGMSPAFAQGEPAARESDWQTGEIHNEETGEFAYCSTEARYDNGLVLIVARTALGETNLVIGFPGGALQPGAEYEVSVEIDDNLSRTVKAQVAHKELLIMPTGRDQELYEALRRGNVLRVVSSSDSTAFRLQGTAAALDELRTCAAQNAELARAIARLSAFPPALRGVLLAAGLGTAQPIMLQDDETEDNRAADHAWALGDSAIGGVIQRDLPQGWAGTKADFNALIEEYINRLRPQCIGQFLADLDPVENLGPGFIQSGQVYCTIEHEANLAAILMYVDQDGFTVFFHEGTGEGEQLAILARNNIAAVLKRVAELAEETP